MTLSESPMTDLDMIDPKCPVCGARLLVAPGGIPRGVAKGMVAMTGGPVCPRCPDHRKIDPKIFDEAPAL